MKTQSEPLGNDFRAEVVQSNFLQLFGYAHEHNIRRAAPTDQEGTPGDIVPVILGSVYYIYVKFPSPVNWKRVAVA